MILAVLAAYRLSRLLVYDDGPKDTLRTLRQAVGRYDYGSDGRPKTQLGRIFECPFCMGVYTSALFAFLANYQTRLGDAFTIWMAVAGAQEFLENVGGIREAIQEVGEEFSEEGEEGEEGE